MSAQQIRPLTHVWIDLETTGLDPREDEIVEIGVVGTDRELNELFAASWLLAPTDRGFERMMSNEVVAQMHERSGLLADLRALDAGAPQLDDVLAEILAMADLHGAVHGKTILSGSGVAEFDRPMLTARAPQFVSALHHRSHDIGILRRIWEQATGEFLVTTSFDKPHRSLDDARDHLAEARVFRSLFALVHASGLDHVVLGQVAS
ncbi:exonuclease domain-containing protein [Oerskovia sp. NPDC060338]|uniref:exonuclease domain-containing protein n=1 Tax=Oerskovia sp. NPDC060338 TaxID=3347100 RepID=UPI00365B3807